MATGVGGGRTNLCIHRFGAGMFITWVCMRRTGGVEYAFMPIFSNVPFSQPGPTGARSSTAAGAVAHPDGDWSIRDTRM